MNTKKLLKMIYQDGPLSQIEAAKTLNITPGTCNLHFQMLMSQNIINSVGTKKNSRGRPTILWDLNKHDNLVLGLAIDPPFLHMGLSDLDGNIENAECRDIGKANTKVQLLSIIDELVSIAKETANIQKKQICHAFVGIGGHLDHKTGTILCSVSCPALNGVNLEAHLRKKHKIESYVDMNGYSIYMGTSKDISPKTTVVIVQWGWGLGIITACNGKLLMLRDHPNQKYRGIWDIAHIRYSRGGRICHCGNHGCMEAYTGGWALLNELSGDGIETLEQIVNAVEHNDTHATEVVGEALYKLGRFMAWHIQLVGAERIIFTGPLAPAFSCLEEHFRRGLARQLEDNEIDSLQPEVKTNTAEIFQEGACQMAAYSLFYRDELVHTRGLAGAADNIDNNLL